MSLVLLSWAELTFLIVKRPYENNSMNRMSIFNEVCVFASANLHYQFLSTNPNDIEEGQFKSAVGWMVIVNVGFNMFVNIAIVGGVSVLGIWDGVKAV